MIVKLNLDLDSDQISTIVLEPYGVESNVAVGDSFELTYQVSNYEEGIEIRARTFVIHCLEPCLKKNGIVEFDLRSNSPR